MFVRTGCCFFFCSNSIILAVFDGYLIMVVQRSGLEF